MAIETNCGEYEGLNYEIDTFDNGSSYEIFEYTPITHIKCIVRSGASCNPKRYSKDNVQDKINMIKLIIKETKRNKKSKGV